MLKGYRAYDVAEQFFAGGITIREFIDRQQAVTLEGLLGQTQSLSVAPMPEHPKYDGMQHALQKRSSRGLPKAACCRLRPVAA